MPTKVLKSPTPTVADHAERRRTVRPELDFSSANLPRKVPAWDAAQGNFPYPVKMSREEYEQRKQELQIELLKLQSWVKTSGQKIVVLFEGRDAAGKGGTIKRFMEHLNPRGARVVALEKPTEREQGQWYFQRYVQHLPTAGEIVMFDRSWYNRAGVERVMGFCSDEQYHQFLAAVPAFEWMLIKSGYRLFKYWFSVSQYEQRRRFASRRVDPLEAVEAEPGGRAVAGPLGRLHHRQGGDVLPQQHPGRALDRDPLRRQEAGAHQLHDPLPALAARRREGPPGSSACPTR